MKETIYTKYPIVAVFWNDPHIMLREELPDESLDDFIAPTLTVGLLYKKTEKFIVLIHTLERSGGVDESDYTIIFTDLVISMKKYGKLKLTKLRSRGSS